MNQSLIAIAKDNMLRISPTKLSIIANSIVNKKKENQNVKYGFQYFNTSH